jgi:ABC-2 type transport system ATP-binding protein
MQTEAVSTKPHAAGQPAGPASGGQPVIEIRNLTKDYRDFWGRRKTRAVNSLSLTINRGEVFGLLGPNGSGKTTTMKLLLGLLFPTDGDIRVFGQPATDVDKNVRIGYLPEESYFYRFLTGLETLDFYGKLFRIPKAERKARSERLLRRVKLNERFWRRQVKEYSKGMTRRIGVAQALINDPELVLLDEPTSGLDPMGRQDMKDIILDLKREGKTVVICGHLLPDIEEICDRIAILYGGELKVLGRFDELLVARGQTQLLTSGLSDEAIRDVKAVLAKHGADVLGVEHPTSSLDDLFLRTVQESQERPGRRYVPGEAPADTSDNGDGRSGTPAGTKSGTGG